MGASRGGRTLCFTLSQASCCCLYQRLRGFSPNRLRSRASHRQSSLCLSFAPHAHPHRTPSKITTAASHPAFLTPHSTPPCLWVNALLTPCPKVTKSLQVAKAQYDVPSYLTQLLVTLIFIYGLYNGLMPLRQLHLTPHPVHMLNGKTNQAAGEIWVGNKLVLQQRESPGLSK